MTAQAEAAASGQAPTAAAPLAPNRKILQMPDEYLPPNKILFIQNLPDSITKEALEALFRQCVTVDSAFFWLSILRDAQISVNERSPYDPRKEKHRFRRVRRRECFFYCEGRFAQYKNSGYEDQGPFCCVCVCILCAHWRSVGQITFAKK